MMRNEIVILFDGFCHLCNRSVDFIMRRDRKKQFTFISLQDEKLGEMFPELELPENTDSVVVVAGSQLYVESDALIQISKFLDFPWNLLFVFRIIPKKIRNLCYRLIARNRYKWFGKRSACRII